MNADMQLILAQHREAGGPPRLTWCRNLSELVEAVKVAVRFWPTETDEAEAPEITKTLWEECRPRLCVFRPPRSRRGQVASALSEGPHLRLVVDNTAPK